MNNTNTSTVISKLHAILEEDLITLNTMISNKSPETDIYKLISSLMDAKKKIVSLLPSVNMDMGVSPHPPQSNQPSTHEKVHKTQIKDDNMITKIFLEIEKDQAEFVKNAIRQDGVATGIQNILISVLEIYHKIIDQLKRSSTTHQVNEIVI